MLPDTVGDIDDLTSTDRRQRGGTWQRRALIIAALCWLAGAGTLLWLLLLATR